jgi:hypothetical protein
MRRGLDAQSSLRIADAALRMARSTPCPPVIAQPATARGGVPGEVLPAFRQYRSRRGCSCALLQIARLTVELKRRGADHRYIPLLMSAPGFGWINAFTVGSEIDDIERCASPAVLCA